MADTIVSRDRMWLMIGVALEPDREKVTIAGGFGGTVRRVIDRSAASSSMTSRSVPVVT